MNKLKGKHILITGASSGIGESIAYKVAESEAIPIMIARSEEKLVSISKNIEERFQIKAVYHSVDITDTIQWSKVLEDILESVQSIDVLINNAGVGYFDTFEHSQWKHVEMMLRLNLEALYYTTYRLVPNMKKHSPTHIVSIGSQAGKIATPKAAVYSATKASVISFSNALRMELKNRIYVTSVNIGPVKTAFFDTADPSGSYRNSVAKYMLDPDDVATKIIKHLFTSKREINLPFWMDFGSKIYQNFPRLMEFILQPAFRKK
ncbi:SDR family NAD(P)-dependent oxidoreductase [Gracilibacillus massiliensis]|uniref:SDR family NAD(P)-dependent oxidoreductase n=1 Tax=Gracilibacillus massiliensis TaxID=1564956 RepID=UPI00071D18AB|nr:SDR family oxidoreductase [Gracilibacillus massiliensis]